MKVLMLNAGSSSLKFSVLDSTAETVLFSGLAEWAGETPHYQLHSSVAATVEQELDCRDHFAATEHCLRELRRIAPELLADSSPALSAVGHRIVHGGDYVRATPLTDDVITTLHEQVHLAPLHNPPSLDTIRAAAAFVPHIPQVACFDTAFHTTMLPAARTYGIPHSWTTDWKIHRYGFHGLSHAYCARRAAELLTATHSPRLVICHLGHGCSASAVRDGRCLDTTMGFTPLEGLLMATRSGSIDPSIVLHLQRVHGLSIDEIEESLNRGSGLLGVSGVSADMREVLDAAHDGNQAAKLAVDVYCHRARQAIGALAVTLGGLDGLVFTAGVGEHAAEVRERICHGLDCLGLHLDTATNIACHPDADVATADSPARILVIATREDLTMLHEVREVLETT